TSTVWSGRSMPSGRTCSSTSKDADDAHSERAGRDQCAVRPPATPAPCESFDLLALAGGLTAHWSRPARSLCASSASFDVELHVRPEGMLRPDQTVEVPELWLPLRGALAVEWEDTPPSDEVGPGALLSLPAGGRARVVSVRPDTVALRLRCS
ncbi:MAG TPA: hypothetical protein VFF36_09550, partial [Planctomycetota bacterium]|nr:hypothetical protein [Planctomycetota bacterium]